jgi:hypothetical protein
MGIVKYHLDIPRHARLFLGKEGGPSGGRSLFYYVLVDPSIDTQDGGVVRL